MKKISSIFSNTFKMFLRDGTTLGVLAGLALSCIFIFSLAKSDGVLLNELRIRLRYGFYVLYGLLSFILMYLACISLRKDLDGRQFHNISSAPVHRYQIWTGKLLGLLFLGLSAFIFSSLVLFACSAIYVIQTKGKIDSKIIKENLIRTYYQCEPQTLPIDAQIEKKYRKMQAENLLPANKSDREIRKEIRNEIRKNEQIIPPGGKKKWIFKWNSASATAYGQFVILKFKFYAQQKRDKIPCRFIVSSPSNMGRWEQEFSVYPYMYHEIKIPLSAIPKSDIIELEFKSDYGEYLIFPVNKDVSFLYDDGSIFKNYMKLLLIVLINMAVLISVGLASASLFSYTVSVFVTLVIYFVGMSSDFFKGVIEEFSYGLHLTYNSPIYFLNGFINFGIWLTQGIKCPPVIEMFTDSASISLWKLFLHWGPMVSVYLTVVIAIGIYFITTKELDKLPSS